MSWISTVSCGYFIGDGKPLGGANTLALVETALILLEEMRRVGHREFPI
jgi:hypothetical protein